MRFEKREEDPGLLVAPNHRKLVYEYGMIAAKSIEGYAGAIPVWTISIPARQIKILLNESIYIRASINNAT